MSEYITDPELLKKLNSSSEKKSDEYITDPDLLSKLNSETKLESRMPKPVEGSGGAAFGVYRPAGRRPESQQDREASKDMPVQTARGIASNVLMGATAPVSVPSSIINSIANAPRTAQDIANRYQSVRSQLAGNERQPLPELPEYNKVAPYDLGWAAGLTPGPEPISPAGQLAFGAGQLVGAPIMPKSVPTIQNIKTGAEAIKTGAKSVGQFTEGAGGVASGSIAKPGETPSVWQKPSSRIVAEETHYPADLQEKWRKGEISTEEMNKGRVEWTPEQRAALEKTQGHVPIVNEVARAAGEQFMEPHMSFKGWLPEIAAASLGGLAGGPLGGLAAGAGALGLKGYQAYKNAKQIGAFNELGQAGFTPQTMAEMNALRTGNIHPVAGPQRAALGLQANMPPSTPALPAPGPVAPQAMPMPGPQRTVNIEGQRSVLPHQIDVSNSQSARPQPIAPVAPTGTPAQVSQQMAAQKLTENLGQQAPKITKDELLAKIRARNNSQPQAPVQPVAPEGMAELPATRWTLEERLAVERERLKQQPQTEMTPQEETQMKKEIKSAEMSPNQRGDIIKKWVAGDRVVQGNTIDVSKGAYNNSNRTRAQAERLLKAGIDEIPSIQGATDSQVIDAMHGYIEKNKPEMFKAKRGPKKKGPEVSQMLTEEQGKMWNSLKANENPFEQKIANMSQQHRDLLEKEMTKNMKPGDTEVQNILNIFEKYRINK